MQNNYLM